MLIVIDYYAENPIENKIIASSNRFRTIENETGYDLVLTQTDATKELKILGNDQPITVQTNLNEPIVIKNARKEVSFAGQRNTPNDTLLIKSLEYITLLANSQIQTFSGTEETQIYCGLFAVHSQYGSSVYPVLAVVSDVNAENHRLIITRKTGLILDLEAIGSHLQFTTGASDIRFNVSTGKIKLANVSNVQITGGSSGQILTTDGAGNLSWTTPSSGGLTTSNFVFNEIPVGLINNVNLNYTLAFTPQANTVQVFVNGLLQKPTTDYTISGSTLSFITPLRTGDELLVHYIK